MDFLGLAEMVDNARLDIYAEFTEDIDLQAGRRIDGPLQCLQLYRGICRAHISAILVLVRLCPSLDTFFHLAAR